MVERINRGKESKCFIKETISITTSFKNTKKMAITLTSKLSILKLSKLIFHQAKWVTQFKRINNEC